MDITNKSIRKKQNKMKESKGRKKAEANPVCSNTKAMRKKEVVGMTCIIAKLAILFVMLQVLL